jgi:hypothetical protein
VKKMARRRRAHAVAHDAEARGAVLRDEEAVLVTLAVASLAPTLRHPTSMRHLAERVDARHRCGSQRRRQMLSLQPAARWLAACRRTASSPELDALPRCAPHALCGAMTSRRTHVGSRPVTHSSAVGATVAVAILVLAAAIGCSKKETPVTEKDPHPQVSEDKLKGVARTNLDSPNPTAAQLERKRKSTAIVQQLGHEPSLGRRDHRHLMLS